MRHSARYFLTLSLTASFVSGCDLAELRAFVDPINDSQNEYQDADDAREPDARQATGNTRPPATGTTRPPATGTKAPAAPAKPPAPGILPGEPAPGQGPVTGAPVGANALNGLYYRTYTYFGGYPTPRLNLVENHYYFSADGQVYDGVPPGGLENFNWDAARQATPGKVGTYTIAGETITFKMADGKTQEMKFEREGEDIRLDGYFASLRGPLAVNLLSGNYFASATAYSFTGEGHATSGHSLKLFPDGTYEGFNIASFDGSMANGWGTSGTRGTYTISGNTLALTGTDGKTTYHTIFPFRMDGDTEARPAAINVDGAMYHLDGEAVRETADAGEQAEAPEAPDEETGADDE